MRNLVLPIGLTLFFVLAAFNPVGKKSFEVTKIVIDPGHGGKDPGTQGSYTKEKDVALEVALKVGEYVKKYIPDVEIIYTRKDDTFIELEKRSEMLITYNNIRCVSPMLLNCLKQVLYTALKFYELYKE